LTISLKWLTKVNVDLNLHRTFTNYPSTKS